MKVYEKHMKVKEKRMKSIWKRIKAYKSVEKCIANVGKDKKRESDSYKELLGILENFPGATKNLFSSNFTIETL